MNKMKTVRVIAFLSFCLIIMVIWQYWCQIAFFLQVDWREWAKLIITTFVGGLLSYFYVGYREDKKEEREKKAACTRVLLNTQMAITFQMGELTGLKELCLSVMNFNLSGNLLCDLLKNIQGMSAKLTELLKFIKNNEEINNILEIAKFIIIKPSLDRIITFPYEVFGICEFNIKQKKINIAEVVKYFNELLICNRRYIQIMSIIERHNEIRDMVINQPVAVGERGSMTILEGEELNKLILIVVAMVEVADKLNEKIESYLEKANKVFTQTGDYIEILSLSKQLPVMRDQFNNISFSKE